jgi:DNA primase
MIPRETIERIFDAAKIEDVVGSYVTLKKRGANLLGLCPFHHEKTGSFTVSPSKGIFKCFGCSKAGNAIGFIMEIEQCSYVEALKTVASMYNIHIEERQLSDEESRNRMIESLCWWSMISPINGSKSNSHRPLRVQR